MKLTSIHATPLAYFLAVAERGSLTQASQTLHVAISAISRQIARLEDELGVALFDRNARGMRLTEAGLVVREYAARAFLDADVLRAELQGLMSLSNSSVRMACTDGFAHDYLPYAIAAFQVSHPGVRFMLDVCAPAEATRKVRVGEVDLALTFAIAAQEGIQVEYSEVAPIYALVSKTHPIAQNQSVTLAALMAYPLVLLTGANTIRQLFDLVCGLQGLRPNIVLTSSSLTALNAYQHYGDVVGFCGSLSVRNRLGKAKQTLVSIEDLEMRQRLMQVQSMAGHHLSPAVRAFVDFLVKDIAGTRRKLRARR